MRSCRKALAVAAVVFGFLQPVPGWSTPDDIVLTADTRDEICEPFLAAVRQTPEYLYYDPALDKTAMADNEANMSSGDNLVFVTKDFVRPSNGKRFGRMRWWQFDQYDHEKIIALNKEGENYDQSYAAYAGSFNIYGRISLTAIELIYKLVPKSRMSHLKMPHIYMTPGSSLAKAVDALDAQDLFLYGAEGFLVVRKPGFLDVYGVTVDRDDVAYADKKFSTYRACTVQSKKRRFE